MLKKVVRRAFELWKYSGDSAFVVIKYDPSVLAYYWGEEIFCVPSTDPTAPHTNGYFIASLSPRYATKDDYLIVSTWKERYIVKLPKKHKERIELLYQIIQSAYLEYINAPLNKVPELSFLAPKPLKAVA